MSDVRLAKSHRSEPGMLTAAISVAPWSDRRRWSAAEKERLVVAGEPGGGDPDGRDEAVR
jgi:hypothetical protein